MRQGPGGQRPGRRLSSPGRAVVEGLVGRDLVCARPPATTRKRDVSDLAANHRADGAGRRRRRRGRPGRSRRAGGRTSGAPAAATWSLSSGPRSERRRWGGGDLVAAVSLPEVISVVPSFTDFFSEHGAGLFAASGMSTSWASRGEPGGKPTRTSIFVMSVICIVPSNTNERCYIPNTALQPDACRA